MNQEKKSISQVLYHKRWVSRDHFRVFVYNESGQKLANSYDEYNKLIESGLWFSTKNEIGTIKRSRKAKNGANS